MEESSEGRENDRGRVKRKYGEREGREVGWRGGGGEGGKGWRGKGMLQITTHKTTRRGVTVTERTY